MKITGVVFIPPYGLKRIPKDSQGVFYKYKDFWPLGQSDKTNIDLISSNIYSLLFIFAI